jgi:ribonucleoside-diphosphate reductase alpha chain
MAAGLPYDSDAGRDYAACLTAIMCGEAYYQSSRIAELCAPLAAATQLTQSAEMTGAACPGFYVNREPFLDVIRMHRASVNNIGSSVSSPTSVVNDKQLPKLIEASKEVWDSALAHGEKHGYRNSQVTVLAPTGTIGFMMDCDTTGIEPDLALVKYKKLVGGGMIKIVNNTVPTALFKLDYSSEQANAIVSYIDATGTIEGAPGLKDEHLPVFDCSFKPAKGTRSIHYMGHIKMMAATQPFISGAISKTVNLPHDATVEDVAEAYIEAWRQGLKAVAIYRDGSKGAQPLNVSDGNKAKDVKGAGAGNQQAASNQQPVVEVQDQQAPPKAVRHRLPEERASLTHKFSIAGHEGYITVGLYPNGKPGEIFIKMAKEGSTVSGLMDAFATSISLALQHGVPLKVLCEKFAHTRFEPSGWTGNEKIGFAKSITDYIFRWLHYRFVEPEQGDLFEGMFKRNALVDPIAPTSTELSATPENPQLLAASSQQPAASPSRKLEAGSVHPADALREIVDLGDAPSCHVCGSIMTRNGSCYRCMSCGSTSGCS